MIELKNISKFYYNKGQVSSGITKVDLKLDIGEFVVVTGESGSGKTTLLNVISGLDSYDEGEMYINGRQTSHFISSDYEAYRKEYIGNIFQDFNLINSYTVYQNVELILRINGYGMERRKKIVDQIIKNVGLTEFAGTKVSKLSGGQKQRVSIARALAKNTDIIVADEPTGNLDSRSAEGIIKLLREIARNKLVIVVTHNYDQFAPYATRKIKLHDGRIVEDSALKDTSENRRTVSPGRSRPSKSMGIPAQVTLGLRNTFNVLPRFMLLLIVFLFTVSAVFAGYTTYRHNEAEFENMGYNTMFSNYSKDRIVLKKVDGSEFSDGDYSTLGSIEHVTKVVENDIMLDNPVSIQMEDISYQTVARLASDFDDDLIAGRMPAADNEAVLTGFSDNDYFKDNIRNNLLGAECALYIADDKEMHVKIVGMAYEDHDMESSATDGSIYMSDSMMSTLVEEKYNDSSTITTEINGKEQEYVEGSPLYRIVPLQDIDEGEALMSKETGNFYGNGKITGHTIKVKADNLYYTEEVELKVTDVYTKKNFTTKTGFDNFGANNGIVFISMEDYGKLFEKGNFQSTVYVDDEENIEAAVDMLETMGFVPLPLNDTIVTYNSGLMSAIQLPVLVVLLIAVFFIAYFVVRLILNSSSSYFTILRMLGLDKKKIRNILNVQVITVINISFIVFIGAALAVIRGGLGSDYLTDLFKYISAGDYVMMYAILIVTGILISGKFTRNLFRKTAMRTYREEELS